MHVGPGTVLSNYRLVEKIGEGGMGAVWKALDTILDREVAVKILSEELARDPERLARFQREARILASLNHPNIAVLHGLHDSEGLRFLTMELVRGQDLATRLRRGPLPVREALRLAHELADALESTHARGIVHRDLKPANICFTPEGHVKVLDFGLARGAGTVPAGTDLTSAPTNMVGSTREGTVLGTAPYMSPEQARGQAVDHRTDIWAFGCVVYEALTGVRAFAGDTWSDCISAVITRDPDWSRLPAGLPKQAHSLLAQSLVKKTARRLDSMARARQVIDDSLAAISSPDSQLPVGAGHTAPDLPVPAAQPSGGPGTQSPESSDPSIAVLPFTNMSADPEDEYLSDGLTEDIINALTQIKGLRVAARSSCFAFRGKDVDIARVGDRLNVATVLEGSVRRAGERLRITAQFIDVASGYQLWSKRFDCKLDDIFAMQDETARAIADRLQIELIGSRGTSPLKRHTPARDAHDLYMRGRYFCYRRDKEGLRRSLEFFSRAIEADPDYPLPHVGISDVYWSLAIYLLRPHAEVLAKGRQSVDRALKLDPDLPEAHASSGIIHMMRGEWSPAEKELKKALELAPQLGLAAGHYAFLLGWQRRVDEIGEWVQRALDAEPLSHYIHGMGGWAHFCATEYEEALRYCRMGLEIDPNSLNCCNCQAMSLGESGRPDAGIRFAEKVVELTQRSPFAVCVLGYLHGRAGWTDEARALLAELRERSSSEYVAPILEGAIHLGMGDRDRARPLYELALREGCPPFYFTAFGRPFPKLLHELGLPS
jgi:serine/threonine protein kinase/tetratricopeptide (TPR) repeat protein